VCVCVFIVGMKIEITEFFLVLICVRL